VAEMIRETDVEPLLPSGSGTIVTDADVGSFRIKGQKDNRFNRVYVALFCEYLSDRVRLRRAACS